MASVKRLSSKLSVFFGAVVSTACSSTPLVGPSIDALPAKVDDVTSPNSLASCPSSPNCVISLVADGDQKIDAFKFNATDPADFQTQLITAIEADGGVVQDIRSGYVWATYTSSLFRFVDDVEWLYDVDLNVFHVRSASRTGYSDLGVNRKRVERLRDAIQLIGTAR